MNNKILIIGAGPSGLSFRLFCNHKTDIVEKNDSYGGHASSFYKNGFTFDYGPHIMFSKYKNILDFMIKSLGKNIALCKRNNKVSYKNRLLKYPFENDLKSLGNKDNYECIRDLIFNDYEKKFHNPKNMYEWLYKTFGKSISDKYLIPYNEKVWNINIKKLSMVWSERIPNPPKKDILKSSIGLDTEGYKHQLFYHYPKRKGYRAIFKNWVKKDDIIFNNPISKIYLKNKTIFVKSKNSVREYEKVVTTMPLPDLINATKEWVPKKIVAQSKKLIINPMYVVSLGILGKDENKYTAIYFPEKDFLVNRISFPSTFSKFNAPKNCHSIQAEITYKKSSKINKMKDSDIIDHVVSGLRKRKLIKGKIILKDLKRCEKSYVVYDLNYKKRIDYIQKFFESKNIFLLGRFSLFEYVNVDMALKSSLKLAAKFNSKNKINIKTENLLLKKALRKIGSI
tara:strand:- start:321 stop:1679 length:1359 start_codon:yes stop_codon:yes gene_type:complete